MSMDGFLAARGADFMNNPRNDKLMLVADFPMGGESAFGACEKADAKLAKGPRDDSPRSKNQMDTCRVTNAHREQPTALRIPLSSLESRQSSLRVVLRFVLTWLDLNR